MTENKRLQIIHLGNPYDFVIKDHQTNRTYGTLQGDDKSLKECLDNIVEENEQLKKENKALTIGENETILKQEATLMNLLNENKELKKLCKTLIGEIEKKSIAFIIDEDVRRMLE